LVVVYKDSTTQQHEKILYIKAAFGSAANSKGLTDHTFFTSNFHVHLDIGALSKESTSSGNYIILQPRSD